MVSAVRECVGNRGTECRYEYTDKFDWEACRRRRREDSTFDRGASARDYIRAEGKLFDTPGLLHPHQNTARLTREEQKLVHISKELRPRTYRIKELWGERPNLT